MFGINSSEFLILLVVAIVVLGPERLPEYAAKLAKLVRQARTLATNARSQLAEQMGPDFDDIDWKQYDPRQYDPRRIVREALMEPMDDAPADKPQSGVMAPSTQQVHDASKPTPWDVDAT
ncbi:twin-arginine translocase TatA/TatE family subunit [Lapillicoccus sp.]|uniref:twin-arginine translocase TatA/TatE family subunit n=1 Tax=Lapillicoccus sp. TaxID=1909287 RepID=UPI0025E20232|nr:twin-arginine translocase TatA/TatE family subunit [Lapillicoccus sp.]